MPTLSTTPRSALRADATTPSWLRQLAVIADTVFNPRRTIGEVERIVALQREAARIEASQPERAAALRAQASRIGRV